MQPEKIWANLPVSDLERSTRFYTQLGFRANGTPNKELTSFRVGDNDFILHFFLKDVLEKNTHSKIADPQQGVGVVFTLRAGSREEVDQWAGEVVQAGGALITQAEAFGPGYYGFVFADPDGNRFNVFHM